MNETQKRAFLGGLARVGMGALRGAGNFGKGMFMLGPTAKAGLGGKAMNMAGKAYGIGAPVVDAMRSGQSGPSVMGMGLGGTPKTGSHLVDHFAMKLARLGASDLADIASYSAFIGSKVVDPHKHPKLHTALDAAGLLGLGATTAHSLATNRADRAPAAKDLVGLALMGSALYDRTKAHGH